MNKLTKIGATALAGALVSVSAHAADWSLSGSAGFELQSTSKTGEATWYQYDSVKVTSSGTTDSGINVSVMYEIDDDTSTSSKAYDDKYISFGTDALGTVTFHGHGGSSVMGQFDDRTPTAYEEVWDIGSGADTAKIGGRSGDSLFTYDSPTIAGATFKAAYQSKDSTTTGLSQDQGDYLDWGFTFSPEMVDGLTVYYAQAELEKTTTGTNNVDQHTIGFTYAYGPVTIGYQESEADATTSTDDDKSESMSIAYAVNDDLTISYGEREFDEDTTQDGATSGTQKDSGWAISYTMGGASVAVQQNTHDNVNGVKATDEESYLLAVNFAF